MHLAVARVEGADTMIGAGVIFGGLIALAFFSNYMEKPGAAAFAEILQCFYQNIEVMPVYRSDIIETKLFKQGARNDHAFDMLFRTPGKFTHRGYRA